MPSSFVAESLFVVISDTLTAQRYIDDILRPVELPFLLRHPRLTFQQDKPRPHTAHFVGDSLARNSTGHHPRNLSDYTTSGATCIQAKCGPTPC
ncbi:hypothetical protein TNCV_480281 [Trichonephila clavipes]|nr:hypothetical protein TNCV_480281 [Trichonephila clavipes]